MRIGEGGTLHGAVIHFNGAPEGGVTELEKIQVVTGIENEAALGEVIGALGRQGCGAPDCCMYAGLQAVSKTLVKEGEDTTILGLGCDKDRELHPLAEGARDCSRVMKAAAGDTVSLLSAAVELYDKGEAAKEPIVSEADASATAALDEAQVKASRILAEAYAQAEGLRSRAQAAAVRAGEKVIAAERGEILEVWVSGMSDELKEVYGLTSTNKDAED